MYCLYEINILYFKFINFVFEGMVLFFLFYLMLFYIILCYIDYIIGFISVEYFILLS